MMYLWGPHVRGAVLWSGARGEHPALLLPGDEVRRGEQRERGSVLAMSGDSQVVVSLGDIEDARVRIVRVNNRISVTLHWDMSTINKVGSIVYLTSVVSSQSQ